MVEMGMDLHSAKSFMIAALRSHMKTSEYVYIIPWLAHVCVLLELVYLLYTVTRPLPLGGQQH